MFTYDDANGRYLIEEYGAPYVDGNTGAQVGVTNVLILKTRCSGIAGDNKGRITVDLTSGGTGYFAVAETYRDLLEQGRPNSPLRYTAPDGTPITLGRGSSYVNIVPWIAPCKSSKSDRLQQQEPRVSDFIVPLR